MSFTVDFEPVGRRVPVEQGETILAAAQRGGILLNATCGGEGVCGRCVVQVMSGEVSESNLTEQAELKDQVKAGWRLACQAKVLGDLRVHIPPESLTTAQRTQTEGHDLPVELCPAVQMRQVELLKPALDDLRSDAARLRDGLGLPELSIPLPVLRTLPDDLRRLDYRVSAFLRGEALVGVRPRGTPPLGLAVDLGTTKLAGYLLDLTSGKTLASAGAMNPQIAYGEDVMARIGHAISTPGGGEQMRATIVKGLNELAHSLCDKARRETEDIADAVVVGNTAMHHLFLGLPVRQLGLSPYVPAESAALDLPAREVGLELATGAYVHLLPNIAGFVGADHVAMLLGSGMLEREGVTLGMDIGTNTEISLLAHGQHYACSTASGPAFEGAHIRHGMRASPGAIEKVLIQGEQVWLQTIEDQPPVGLCGSGILDLVAQLYRAGIINAKGNFIPSLEHPRLRSGTHGMEFVLVRGEENHGIEVTFSRSDINEIQLAKGAMRTGVQVLLRRAGISEGEIDTVVIAGAFGTYLDVHSGIEIGMFPRLPREKFIQVGNAAGTGARLALLSTEMRARAKEIARRVRYVELTSEPAFSKLFAKSLLLGQGGML
jgi:uncharacterized 2Fe-2S/4Fe-4S cluster protein (DUF4445 family)